MSHRFFPCLSPNSSYDLTVSHICSDMISHINSSPWYADRSGGKDLIRINDPTNNGHSQSWLTGWGIWKTSISRRELENPNYITLFVQVIAALGVVASVFYLSLQIRQQNKIASAEFGHHLTERLYNRYFQTAKDADYCEFLARDWASDEVRTAADQIRITHSLGMYLVDIHDVYQKVDAGMVAENHLT